MQTGNDLYVSFMTKFLTLMRPWWPPLDISRDNSATRRALATTLFYDNFLSSFPYILTPNLWRPGVQFPSYVTFCTKMYARRTEKGSKCDFVYKINANWFFFFSHLVHINMLIFTLNCASKSVCDKFHRKKTTKQKVEKTKKYIHVRN